VYELNLMIVMGYALIREVIDLFRGSFDHGHLSVVDITRVILPPLIRIQIKYDVHIVHTCVSACNVPWLLCCCGRFSDS